MVPEYIVERQKPKMIIVAHNGALGDFLCCWPGMLAIARRFMTTGNSTPLYFLGREAMLPWLTPLGYAPCPPELRAAMETLYTSETLPNILNDSTIFWFCLDKPPQLPCLPHNLERIIPLPLLLPPEDAPGADVFCGGAPLPHVLLTLKMRLERLGFNWPEDWRKTWQSLFGSWQGRRSREIALLPGSGHKNKEWPLRHFADLAEMLAAQGWKPLFIIGEAELERGLIPPPGSGCENPFPPPILGERLRQVRAIVSNDAGPAHLAGLYGIPGVVLFGPTPPETWGAPGMVNISQGGIHPLDQRLAAEGAGAGRLDLNFADEFAQMRPTPCAPCAALPRHIDCPAPFCLEKLPPALVLKVLTPLLDANAK